MEVRSGVLPSVDLSVTVGRVATLLSTGGHEALPEVLEVVVSSLGLRSAVLRDATGSGDGAVLAVAGGVMHAVPLARRPRSGRADAAAVQLPVRAGDRQIATLTVVGARPSQLPALRAITAVLALRLQTPRACPAELFAAADDEVSSLADALHDGPVQDLVVARYAADAAAAGADPHAARDAVQGALVALRRALWLLRPRGAADGGLPEALSALSGQLSATGATPLLLELDPRATAALGSAEAATAYRLVQACVGDGAVPGRPVRVTLAIVGTDVVLSVDGGRALPSPRWTARAHALGARVTTTPGRQELAFPSRLDVAP